MPTLTIEDSKNWRMQQSMRGHGRGFFFYEFMCIEQPRLRRKDVYTKKDRSVDSKWYVDGEEVDDLASGIERLNLPPVFDVDELRYLRELGQLTADGPVKSRDLDFAKLFTVSRKGAVEVEDQLCQLSDIGRAAIA